MAQKEQLLRWAGNQDRQAYEQGLRDYVLERLRLPTGIRENDLYRLCVLSLKLQLHQRELDAPDDLEARLKKYDCHQTEAAVQKKVLLLMHLERWLDIPAAPGGCLRTLEELSGYLYQCLQGRNDQCCPK